MSALRDTIRPHALAGLPPREIACVTGLHHDTVRAALSVMRKLGEILPVHQPGRPAGRAGPPASLSVALSDRVSRRHQAEAKRRGVDPDALAAKVLSTIARDGLYGAVLDDGEG